MGVVCTYSLHPPIVVPKSVKIVNGILALGIKSKMISEMGSPDFDKLVFYVARAIGKDKVITSKVGISQPLFAKVR